MDQTFHGDRDRRLLCIPIRNVSSSFIDHLYEGNLQKGQAKEHIKMKFISNLYRSFFVITPEFMKWSSY